MFVPTDIPIESFAFDINTKLNLVDSQSISDRSN